MSQVEINNITKRFTAARGMLAYWQIKKQPACIDAWFITVQGLENRLEREALKLEHFAQLNKESLCYAPLMCKAKSIHKILESE